MVSSAEKAFHCVPVLLLFTSLEFLIIFSNFWEEELGPKWAHSKSEYVQKAN